MSSLLSSLFGTGPSIRDLPWYGAPFPMYTFQQAPSEWMTPLEAKLELQLTDDELASAIEAGEIPILKIGNSFRINRGSLRKAVK